MAVPSRLGAMLDNSKFFTEFWPRVAVGVTRSRPNHEDAQILPLLRRLRMARGARVLAVQAGSSLTVPLRLFDRVIGIFNIESGRLGAFKEQDRLLAEIFARYVATALHILNLLLVERYTTRAQATGVVQGELSEPINDLIAEAEALKDQSLDPEVGRQERALDTKLATQGLPVGGEAAARLHHLQRRGDAGAVQRGRADDRAEFTRRGLGFAPLLRLPRSDSPQHHGGEGDEHEQQGDNFLRAAHGGTVAAVRWAAIQFAA